MKKNGYTLPELMIVIFIIIVLFAIVPIVAVWTGHNLDFWLTHFKGHPIHVPFWIDLALTIVGNGVILLLNIVSEVLKLLV